MFFMYVGCSANPRLIPGIDAELEKKSALGTLVIVNLNPTGDR
jgi:hypothetical protein